MTPSVPVTAWVYAASRGYVTGGSAGSVSSRSTRMTLIRPFGSMYARPTTTKLNVAGRAQLAGVDLS